MTGVGIIGCGNISTAYLKLGPLFKGLEIRAVADLNPDAATARAAEFGVRAETVEGLLVIQSRGRPRTRSPRMLRWTSLVPPPMVRARA